jgi:predicted Zn-dependent protease with MMP-like domain
MPASARRLPALRYRMENGRVVEVDSGHVEEMVASALDGLPEELGRLMSNVAVTVEHGAGPPGLLGLYEASP